MVREEKPDMTDDLTPEIFTADYIGEPGHRTFFIQARGAAETVSFLLEKQQVAVLAEKLREILLIVDGSDTIAGSAAERDPGLALAQPIEPEWRVGAMGLAYEEVSDRVLVVLQPVQEEEEEEEEEKVETAEDAPEAYRFALRRDQARAFVLHTEAIVAEGRPLCQLCGLPMDPEGHICPASNGHRPTL
jgi:uncharacterized repeat protein (TIGR03847 family)